MNTGSHFRRSAQLGFSLIELMVVLLILTVVMGVVFTDIANVQKRYRTEETKLDLTQEAREFLDQIVRDLRQAGYPNTKQYDYNVLGANPDNDLRNSVGIVRLTPMDIVFEGDMDGDGQVDSVRYTLTPDVGGTCPCTIRRSQGVKVAGGMPVASMPIALGGAQPTTYQAEVQNVINSGNVFPVLGTTVLGGVVRTNDSIYADYKVAPLFQAFQANGTEVVLPVDMTTVAGKNTLRSIRTIRINMNVIAPEGRQDLSTGLRPAVAMTATARIIN